SGTALSTTEKPGSRPPYPARGPGNGRLFQIKTRPQRQLPSEPLQKRSINLQYDRDFARPHSFPIACSIRTNVFSRPSTSKVSNSGGAFLRPHTATRMV